MPYLIDGHNLIGKLPTVSLQEIDDENRLVELLQVFCHQQRKKVEVYFDNAPPGSPRARRYGSVSAYYVRSDKTADQAIMERLKSLKREARNWIVVSSDNQVRRAAQAAQAHVLSSEEFSQQLLASPNKPSSDLKKGDQPLSEAEVEEYLRLFQHRRSK